MSEREPLRVAVQASDPIRRHGLVAMMETAGHVIAPAREADVLVADVVSGERLPEPGHATIVVLSDNPSLEDDPHLAAVLPRAVSAPVLQAAIAAASLGLMVRTRARCLEAESGSQLASTGSHFAPPNGGPGLGSRSSESMNRALTKKRLEPDDFDTESSGSRRAFRPAENEAEPALLTSRELEILAAIGEGLTNKEVARRLGISPHTVKFHLEAIFEKLGAGSRAEAIAKGLRQHLIEL